VVRFLVPLVSASLLLISSLQAQVPAGAPAPGQITPPRDTAQRPQTGTGRIRGRVTAAGSNTPLRRVQMVLQLLDNPQSGRVTNTDAQGRYEFTELPAGSFSLGASRPGYLRLQYGQRHPYEGGTAIALSVGETISAIDFALPRGSVIAGRITDESGEAVPQVQVRVQRFQYAADGQRRLATTGQDITDDRGEFRIYGLMPGEYVVHGVTGTVASQANEINEGYPPTFYPGTPNVNQAQPITLGLGDEVNIQFGLTAARLARISGTVRDSDGRAAVGQAALLHRSGGSMGSNSTSLGPDGSFNIGGVPPGEYVLEVWRPLAGTDPSALMNPEAAAIPIVVTGNDIVGLSITTSRGAVVSGRVVWEGTAPKTGAGGPAVLRVNASSVASISQLSGADLDPNANGQLDEHGNFRLGVLSRRVLIGVSTPVGPTGWMLKSVMLDGRDITNVPLDVNGNVDDVRITMTDKITGVAGRVTDSRGAAVPQFVVVIQPAEALEPAAIARLVRALRPNTSGRFEVRGLRPGRYLASAVTTMETNGHFSPKLQRELRRDAREFSLKEGESLTLDLRLSPTP
jgi:hypothetical protein